MGKVEIIQYKQIQGMSLFLNKVEYRTPHLHPEWELIWILEGKLDIKVEDSTYYATKNNIVLFPPGTVHELNAKTEASTFLCLQMTPNFLNIPSGVTTENLFPQEYLTPQQIINIKKTLLEIASFYFNQPPLYQMFCAGQCNLLLHEILQKMPTKTLSAEELSTQKKKTDRLNRLINYVEQHYAEKIKLSDFAKLEGVTMNYLSHFVRASLNQNFQSYVNLVRFHAGCKLISTQKYKMMDVCRLTGFSDYKYFSNSFKLHSGLTPEEYSQSIAHNKLSLTTESITTERNLSPQSSERILTKAESLEIIGLIKAL